MFFLVFVAVYKLVIQVTTVEAEGQYCYRRSYKRYGFVLFFWILIQITVQL